MTDHEIDMLVIRTINQILKHVTFEEEDGLCVASPALIALREAFKTVAAHTTSQRDPKWSEK